MNQKVEDYLNGKKDEDKKSREEFLIAEGLYDRVYSENPEDSLEYPYREWDDETKTNRFYKKVAIEVTDEEFDKIMESAEETDVSRRNSVGTFMSVIAWIIYVCGFIAGAYQAGLVAGEFSFAVAGPIWIWALICGTVFLGFSEVIQLLDEIKYK